MPNPAAFINIGDTWINPHAVVAILPAGEPGPDEDCCEDDDHYLESEVYLAGVAGPIVVGLDPADTVIQVCQGLGRRWPEQGETVYSAGSPEDG